MAVSYKSWVAVPTAFYRENNAWTEVHNSSNHVID
jgi:hypothetical protein